MSKQICPGQDTRFWRPGDIFTVTCANCGLEVEFFKDDASRRCPRCRTRIKNPRLALGCAQWCEHAKECLGFDPKKTQLEKQETALVDRLIEVMKRVFGSDKKRIEHAFAVLNQAKEILREEKADPKTVMATALLHDISIPAAERKHGSSAGLYHELEGSPHARAILEELELDNDTIDHVCRIIAHHHSAKDIDTPEFRILWDADWLVNIAEKVPTLDAETLKAKIEKVMKTERGKRRAYELYLPGALARTD